VRYHSHIVPRSEFEKDVEAVFKAPGKVLKESVDAATRVEKVLINKVPLKQAEEYWNTLGPGLTTGAADDDPSSIATYSQAGARYGFQLIWLSLFTYPFMAVVQEMCARIGLVTGQGLAANIRRHYSTRILYGTSVVLLVVNVINIAADLSVMAAATQLLFPEFSFHWLVIGFALVSLLLQVFTTYARYAKYLKYLTLALLSYVVVALAVNLNWAEVLTHTLVPTITFSRDQIILICAILGTTISPYLFFWQTSQEVEEEILHGETSVAARRKQVGPDMIRRMRIDVWSGMLFSSLISFFIFAACAGTLFVSGITEIKTAADAAIALKPFGDFAYLLFALGIIGTGLLAVPVFAGSTAYAFAESFGWKYGLYRSLRQAYSFYGVVIVAMGIGVLANFLTFDPITALIYAAVANGITAPFVLFFVVRLSSNTRLMGEYANGPLTAFVGWATIGIMSLAGIAALIAFW
jgi:NRAMP (natural resistance-associated macrophage protein)-like metal ion transporter